MSPLQRVMGGDVRGRIIRNGSIVALHTLF
jgi:hypothetical protein